MQREKAGQRLDLDDASRFLNWLGQEERQHPPQTSAARAALARRVLDEMLPFQRATDAGLAARETPSAREADVA